MILKYIVVHLQLKGVEDIIFLVSKLLKKKIQAITIYSFCRFLRQTAFTNEFFESSKLLNIRIPFFDCFNCKEWAFLAEILF